MGVEASHTRVITASREDEEDRYKAFVNLDEPRKIPLVEEMANKR